MQHARTLFFSITLPVFLLSMLFSLLETTFIPIANSFAALYLKIKLSAKSNQSCWLRHFFSSSIHSFIFSRFYLLSYSTYFHGSCIRQFSQSIGTKLWVLNLWLLFTFIIIVINVVVIFLIHYLCLLSLAHS